MVFHALSLARPLDSVKQLLRDLRNGNGMKNFV